MKKYKDLNTNSKLQRSQMWVPITIHEKVSLTRGDNGLSTVKWGLCISTKEYILTYSLKSKCCSTDQYSALLRRQ